MPKPSHSSTVAQTLSIISIIIGIPLQALAWGLAALIILELSNTSVGGSPLIDSIREEILSLLKGGPTATPLFLITIALHLACLYHLTRDSSQKPSPLIILGWSLSVSASSCFPLTNALIVFSLSPAWRGNVFLVLSICLFVFVLVGIPLICMTSRLAPAHNSRKAVWLQTLLLFLVSLPFILLIAIYIKSIGSSMLSLDLWVRFGFPLAALTANLLALFFSKTRHRKLLLLQSALPLCPNCQYNLTGTIHAHQTKCPECGSPIPQFAKLSPIDSNSTLPS
jgi:hypothetical protein